MNRTKLILLVSVLLVFAAGASLGMYMSRLGQTGAPQGGQLADQQPTSNPATHPRRDPNPLGLSADQQEAMRKVWTDFGPMSRAGREKRDTIRKDRDQQIQDMLSPEQREKMAAIQKEYAQKTEQLTTENKKAFDEGIRKILTPDQVVKYDQMLKRETGGPRGRGGPRGPATGPRTTEPAAPAPAE